MAMGPGKYDELCTYVREKAGADGAIVLIFGGEDGPGFSVQADARTLFAMPGILREMADQLAADIAQRSKWKETPDGETPQEG